MSGVAAPAGLPELVLHAGPTASVLVTGTQEPQIGDELTEYDVSPGVIGFLVTFAVVVACIPLFRSMTGKLRKVDRRAQEEAREEAAREEAAREAGTGRAGNGSTGTGRADEGGRGPGA